jgi:hypothetical protein
MGYTIKDSIQIFAGYILLFLGLFVMIVGAGMMIAPQPNSTPSDGLTVIAFSSIFIAPGILLIYKGKNIKKDEARIDKISGLINTYRRIKIDKLAENMELNRKDILDLLARGQSLGIINGHIDRTTDEFFTEEGSVSDEKKHTCSSCGAPITGTFLKGESVICTSCGFKIQ